MNTGNRQLQAHAGPAMVGQDEFGRQVARHIGQGLDQLPHDITERLRAARMQALAARKRPVTGLLVARPAGSGAWVATGVTPGGAAALGQDDGPGPWQLLGSALPILMLIIGLVLINDFQSESRARELADVDTALLTDEVPPAAYADPGFLHFMQSGE